jgi:alkylhydroperoxidase family enzyme
MERGSMSASNASSVWNKTIPSSTHERLDSTLNPEALAALEPRTGPRLTPIETPQGLKLRFTYWGMRHWMGKVMTPVKIINARVPESLGIVSSLQKFVTKGVTLEPGLQVLLAHWVAQINGCTFCEDLGRAFALRKNLGLDVKLDALEHYRTDPTFSPRERAALAYAEEVTRTKRASDATFAALRQQFSEREIVEITLLNAVQNFYNLTNVPLGIGSDGFCALERTHTARPRSG